MIEFGLWTLLCYTYRLQVMFVLVSLITGDFEINSICKPPKHKVKVLNIKVNFSNDRAMKHFCRNVVIAQ